jgi:hypothetical protein
VTLRIADRVYETTVTTGTGALALAAAVTGYIRFADIPSIATNDTVGYCVYAVDGNGNPSGAWEVGVGTYSSANTLTRTTVEASSNAGAAVDFAAGTKHVIGNASAAFLSSLYRLGGTDVAVADGGTGASTAAAARSNLGAAAHDPAIQAVTSAATVTPTFSDDQVNITAQGEGLTLANPTGTAVSAWGITVRIKDNGTARAISYGTQYRAIGVTLPTTTVISKTLYLGIIYNATDTKWDVVAVAQEA